MPTPNGRRVMTDADITEQESGFLDDVKRELHILVGSAWTKDPLKSLLRDARDRVRIQSSTQEGVYQRHYTSRKTGVPMTARQCAEELNDMADDLQRLASYGPDVVVETVDRLKGVGIPEDEARARAATRVGRDLSDGRAWVHEFGAKGKNYFSPAMQKDREYSANELAQIREHNPAVVRAVRSILADIEKGTDPQGRPAGWASDPDPIATKRAQVEASF